MPIAYSKGIQEAISGMGYSEKLTYLRNQLSLANSPNSRLPVDYRNGLEFVARKLIETQYKGLEVGSSKKMAADFKTVGLKPEAQKLRRKLELAGREQG